MSFPDIATGWAAELASQPNPPSYFDILRELYAAIMRGMFEDEKGSRVTMPLVGGETIKGQNELRERSCSQSLRAIPFLKVSTPFDDRIQILPCSKVKTFKKTDLPAPYQVVTRDDMRDGIRQCKEWRTLPIAEAPFEDLAEIPIERLMESGLGEAIRLCHISFADFDALRKSLGREPPLFWKGSAEGQLPQGRDTVAPEKEAAVVVVPEGAQPSPGLAEENGSPDKVGERILAVLADGRDMLERHPDWSASTLA